jgi:ABC-type transport system substrate-binding protein
VKSNYWNRTLDRRLSRRSTIALAGTGTAAAAFLAACGGGDSDSGAGVKDANSLIVKVQDETSSVVRGGIYRSVLGTPPSLDPHFTGPQTTHCWMCYSQLLRTKPGHMQNTNGEVEPELLESWEISPDSGRSSPSTGGPSTYRTCSSPGSATSP